MSDEITAPVETGSEQPTAIELNVPQGTPKDIGTSEAARILSNARKAKREAAPPPEEVPQAAAETELPPETEEVEPQPETEDADETQEADTETPSIEPPRSWSKEKRELWSSLDPAMQAYVAERDRQDTAAVQKAQREAAEVRRSIDTERFQMEQARQQYEAIVAQTYQTLASSSEFADIQTPADEMRLAKEDVLRFAQYQAHKSQLQQYGQATYEAQQRQQQQYQQELSAWGQEQDTKAMETIPEAKDEAKWKSLREESIRYLRDVGFSDQELSQLWSNSPLRDYRMQRIIADAAKARSAKANLDKAKTKSVPPVHQRPGVAPARVAQATADLKSLEQKLKQTGSDKDAARLLAARRASR